MSGKIVATKEPIKGRPIVISTWDAGLEANMGAWKVLGAGGRALDAVEQGSNGHGSFAKLLRWPWRLP
jgi:hypothetical protein